MFSTELKCPMNSTGSVPSPRSTNRKEMYAFLSLVLDKTEEEIDRQGFIETYNDIQTVMGGEFFAFFTLLSRMAQTL